MRDDLIVTLIISAVSALAFVAYRHPEGYARLYVPMLLTSFAIFATWCVYSVGYQLGFSDASIECIKAKPPAVVTQPKLESFPFVAFILLILFITLLRFLPVIFDLPSKRQRQDYTISKDSEDA